MEYLKACLDFIGQWYWLPLIFLYAGVIGTLLIENGNPNKTISWILIIVFVPVAGMLLYYFFGQKYNKVKRIKKVNEEQAKRLEREWERLEPYMVKGIKLIRGRIGPLSRVFTFLKNERLSSPTLDNKVQLLLNGEQKFPLFLEALKTAKHSIHIEYYIFEVDGIGVQILNLLEQKAKDGVYVRLIVDSFGSPELVKYMRKKKDSKIDFKAFMPVTFTSLANSNYRNHRKIAIIDGTVGFVGGINISDRYINDEKLGNSVFWRDTSVRIEGAAVNMLQISFWNAWNLADGAPFLLSEGYLQKTQQEEPLGEAAVSFVFSDPSSEGPYNMEAMLIGIGEADRKIQLVTPYYIPSEELATALQVAAAAGLEVELMLPKKSDSYIVQHASLSFIKPLLRRGVKVYFYTKGFIHAKTLNIDGKLSYVGTVNLDTRSFYINYEISALISDKTLCQELADSFERDKADCELMTLAEWKQRKPWKRAIDSLCRLMAPLL